MLIRGTDLDMLVSMEVPCSVAGEIATTVDAGRLTSAVDTMRPGAISMRLDKGVLILSQGAATRRLPTLPIDAFPVVKLGDVATSFEMPAADIITLLGACATAMSTEETRYYLNGIFLQARRRYQRRDAGAFHDLPDRADGGTQRVALDPRQRTSRAGSRALEGALPPRVRRERFGAVGADHAACSSPMRSNRLGVSRCASVSRQ